MLSIFKKREYLVDHLEGITDIHNHILPGIDDGAANIEESIKLLLKYKELGITDFIATPHVMNEYYPNTKEKVNSALQDIKEAISGKEELKNTRIKAAAEYMMDQNFLDILESKDILTLKDNFVLVEMSYFQAPINLNEILFKLQTKGYKPILAHPERYGYLHSKDLSRYKDLKNRGCSFQMNMLSLTSHYGNSIEKMAQQLLKENFIDFVGSDTHRVEHLEKLASIKLSNKTKHQIKKAIENTKSTF